MRLKAGPRIYGLIGYPIKHSLSPAMHNAAFKTLKINAEYRLLEIRPDGLKDFLLKDILVRDIDGNTVSAKALSGFNITIPHKVKAKEILEEKFPLSYSDKSYGFKELFHYVRVSGAINTVKREKEQLRYWNTDVSGFYRSLKEDLKFDAKNKNVLLIGCGGAGRAVIACLSWKSPKANRIYIYENNNEAASFAREHFSQFSFLKEKLEFISTQQIPNVIGKCHLLVNASPVGMKEGDPSIIDKELLPKELYVYDLVYNRETQLIKDARENLGDSKVAAGLGMLLYQGARAFELWTGKKAPIDTMRQALLQALNG